MAASQRAKQLLKGAPPLVRTKNKYIVTALREIAEEKVTVKERTIGRVNS
jgi:DNA-directed RNA polymerase omega subunit